MVEREPMGARPSTAQSVKRVLMCVLLIVVALLVAYGGIKFWAETLNACEKEGNSYTYCLITMRYQATKELFTQ